MMKSAAQMNDLCDIYYAFNHTIASAKNNLHRYMPASIANASLRKIGNCLPQKGKWAI